MTITVLPKPWSPTPRSSMKAVVRDYAHAPGTTTHVVAHETELATLSTTASSVGALAMSLTDVAREQADLLAIGVPPADSVPAAAASGNPFPDLINLMLLAQRGRLTMSPLSFEGAFASSLLRLLSHERLLQVVERLVFQARPHYAERTELLEMPYGRLGERGLLFSLATGTPRLESTFDELTVDTPLLQVMASALRVVASERLHSKIAVLRPGLQMRAVHLLRHLSNVRLIDRERALHIAERLWLGPLDRIWEPAIDASVPVLRDRAVVPADGSQASEAFLVHVSTERFWEQCLELALESAFRTLTVSRDARQGEGVSVPAPWALPTSPGAPEAATKILPDFMFRSLQRVVVADAKYKLGAGRVPSTQDGYQIFAYSHLATLGGQASDVGLLLYPTREGQRPRQLVLERLRDRNFPLWLVRLPFPTRADVQNQGSWGAFLARLACIVRDFSADWGAASPPQSAS